MVFVKVDLKQWVSTQCIIAYNMIYKVIGLEQKILAENSVSNIIRVIRGI
jgi:hypothetical protein